MRHLVESDGKLREKTGAGALAHLIWSDADRYASMFDAMLDSDGHVWEDVMRGAPERFKSKLPEVIVSMVLDIAANFNRRIVTRLRRK